MAQHHQGYQQQQDVHRDLRYHMHHVFPNTSSSALTHGTGLAATNDTSSSFQTPGQSVSSSPYTPPIGDKSRVPSLASSNQHTLVAAVPSSLKTRPIMGHGQSKSSLPLPPQSLSSAVDPVLDAGLSATKGMNLAGGKLKRAFGAKRKELNDPSSLASKETSGGTIGVSQSISSSSRPSEYAPDPFRSSIPPSYPSSQVLNKYLATSPSPSNSAPLSQPSASFSGPTNACSSGKHPKSSLSTPATAGNRSSVIAVSPGISSAINFMMMECQEPSAPRLVVNTSLSSLPSGDAESSNPTKDNESQKEKETVRRHSGIQTPTSPDKRELKESWRKSDSTNSHHTVRANSLRASRPVSWAESFHSAYTIVPPNGGMTSPQGPSSRRLSGLIADVHFGVREEELEEDLDPNVGGSLSLPSRRFATSNSTRDPNKDGKSGPLTTDIDSSHKKPKDLSKKAKRRSMSLSSALPDPLGGLLTGTKPLQAETPVPTRPLPAFPSAADARKVSHSISGIDSFRNAGHPHVHKHSRQKSENLLHQRPPLPLHSPDLRASLLPLLPPLPSGPPGIPPDSPADSFGAHTQFPPPTISASHSLHLRQPTVSGLGPSAAGIAKRAVERMGKRLGDMMTGLSSSSNSSVSGHSSSTSISTSASTSVTSGMSLIPSPLVDGKMQQSQIQGPSAFVPGRTASRGSNPSTPLSRQGPGHSHHHSVIHNFLPGPSKSGGHKRLQKSLGSTAAMSEFTAIGASSSNLSSTSEPDPFSPTGPILGRRLRGPIKRGNIFGKELRVAIKETRVVVTDDGVDAVEGGLPKKVGLIKALEYRVLPAVVARCAQHLLIWGVQEEGLFRVNGRPRHVSHLRAEFDSGADYDMTECSPGELDPHAVASVFKAYLRELPDSILTHKLQSYFDAAINKENSMHSYGQQSKSQQPSTKSHQGLPSCPRDVAPSSLRKPLSLSTLAMPSFNHVPPPSRSLVHAFRSLIAQLPPENRDLLRTVVDLIKATAKGSKETKMPLSNLLLLFCPSLNMSPPLLRLLCEAEGIWDEERIYPSRGAEEDRIVDSDGAASMQNTSGPRDEEETDARSGFDEASSLRSGRASSDNPSSLDYHASAEEDSLLSEERAALGRRDLASRPEVPTVYLDTQSHLSSSSGSLLEDAPKTGSFMVHTEIPDDGSISSDPCSPKAHNWQTYPSLPMLSPSADSLSTHTSSTNPSLYDFPLDGGEDPAQQKRSDSDLTSTSARPPPQFVVVQPLEIRKRPLISNPIPISGPLPVQYPFPTSRNREHVPNTPSRRRSIPLLSLSSLSNRSSGSPSPLSKNSPYQAESRSKKASLKLLFSKKSSSSLLEDKEKPIIRLPFLQPPEPHFQHSPRSASGSDSSVSTPLSAVTAPQGSGFFSLSGGSQEGPPVLNTRIEDSSLKFDEAMNSDKNHIMDTASSGLVDLSPLSSTKVSTSRSVSDDPVSHSKAALANSNTRPSPANRLPFSQPRNDEWVRSVVMADAALPSHSKLR